jgi:hypothetical protein
MGMIISLQESYTLAMCPSSAAPRAEYLLVAMSHERRYSTMQRTCRYSGRDWTWRRPVPSRTGAKCHCLLAQPEKASSLCTASADVTCVAILGPNLNRSGLAPSRALHPRRAGGSVRTPCLCTPQPAKVQLLGTRVRTSSSYRMDTEPNHDWSRAVDDTTYNAILPTAPIHHHFLCPRTFSPEDRERAPRGERACAPRPESRAHPCIMELRTGRT